MMEAMPMGQGEDETDLNHMFSASADARVSSPLHPLTSSPLQTVSPSYEQARAFLERDLDGNLPLLTALEYEPIETVHAVARDGGLVALALVLEPEGPPSRRRSAVLLDARDEAALVALLARGDWPADVQWVTHRRALLATLASHAGVRPVSDGGLRQYIATRAVDAPRVLVRQLVLEDADALALAPCALSPVALRNWIKRGWRVFGAVADGVLLGHALAAYPVGDVDEVAAVFTAPHARRRGIARSVVAAALADIVARGRRATYVCKKTNIASQRVAEGLGFVPLLETWEFDQD